MEPSWSLHLLSEILAAFSTDDPENLRTVLNRVAEAVDAEVAAILCDGQLTWCIGLAPAERELLLRQAPSQPTSLAIQAGPLRALRKAANLGEGGSPLAPAAPAERRSQARAPAARPSTVTTPEGPRTSKPQLSPRSNRARRRRAWSGSARIRAATTA